MTESLLSVVGEVDSELSGVFTLLVPKVAEEDADRGTLSDFLCRRLGDRVAQDDAKREVGLAKLSHGKVGKSKEGESLQTEGRLVLFTILLVLGDRVCDYRQIVSISVAMHLQQGSCKALIRGTLTIKLDGLFVKLTQLSAANRGEIHFLFNYNRLSLG